MRRYFLVSDGGNEDSVNAEPTLVAFSLISRSKALEVTIVTVIYMVD